MGASPAEEGCSIWKSIAFPSGRCMAICVFLLVLNTLIFGALEFESLDQLEISRGAGIIAAHIDNMTGILGTRKNERFVKPLEDYKSFGGEINIVADPKNKNESLNDTTMTDDKALVKEASAKKENASNADNETGGTNSITNKKEKIIIYTVAVGKKYREEVNTNLREQACYALKNEYIRAMDTRNMYQIYEQLNFSDADVGEYFSHIQEWYGPHGWRWAWTKAFSLLSLLLTGGPGGTDFDWVLYMDPDVAIREGALKIEEIFSQARKLAKISGYKWEDYHTIITQSDPGRPKPTFTGGTTNNDVILLRKSPESIEFLRSWIRHSDCECWVDQGAYYLETLRWIGRFMANNNMLDEYTRNDASTMCNTRFQDDIETNKTYRWLESLNCFDKKVRYRSRRCTWTRPGKMLCKCSFIGCTINAYDTYGYSLGRSEKPHVPPPVMVFSASEKHSLMASFRQGAPRKHSEGICQANVPASLHVELPDLDDDHGVLFAEWKLNERHTIATPKFSIESRVVKRI